MLPELVLKQYNNTRTTRDKSRLCHAPFTSIYFDIQGRMTACCYNRTSVLGTYPTNSIDDAWFGPTAEALRQSILANDLSGGCYNCQQQLLGGNYHGMKGKGFEQAADYPTVALAKKAKNLLTKGKFAVWPTQLEFELSNTCNLECTMCDGFFSSSIRKNREQLPALANHYDAGFVKQLDEYLPHVRIANFLGGEPFLIDLYYQIWDRIEKLNPYMQVNITTNGTISNQKVERALQKLKCGFNISIDALDPALYASIRKNASIEKVLANFEYFKQHALRTGSELCITVCPMANNWQEIPKLLAFCNQHGAYIYFNTVTNPANLSLTGLPIAMMQEIIAHWRQHLPQRASTRMEVINLERYTSLINQLESWEKEAAAVALDKVLLEALLSPMLQKISPHLLATEIEHSVLHNLITLMALAELEKIHTLTPWQQEQRIIAQESNQGIFNSMSDAASLELFFKVIKHLVKNDVVAGIDYTTFTTKIDYLQSLCANITPNHLQQMLRVQPVAFVASIETATEAEMSEAYNRSNKE